MARELTSRTPSLVPAPGPVGRAVPHTPMRKPPGAVR